MLISTLTNPVPGKQIETFQELADSDYYIQATPGITPTNLLLSSDNPGLKAVAAKLKSQTKRSWDSTEKIRGNELKTVATTPKVDIN